jgi:hypothetical protein
MAMDYEQITTEISAAREIAESTAPVSVALAHQLMWRMLARSRAASVR